MCYPWCEQCMDVNSVFTKISYAMCHGRFSILFCDLTVCSCFGFVNLHPSSLFRQLDAGRSLRRSPLHFLVDVAAIDFRP